MGRFLKIQFFYRLLKNEYRHKKIDEKSIEAMHQLLKDFQSGTIGYEKMSHALLVRHAQPLAGKSQDEMTDLAKKFLETNMARLLRPFASEISASLGRTHELYIVTAEPAYMAEAMREAIGMTACYATNYVLEDGYFTGEIDASLAGREAKRAMLAGHTVDFAFGDTIGDLGMLEVARHPVAVCPSQELRAIAVERGWKIIDGESLPSEVSSAV